MANFDPHDPEESHTSNKDPQQGGKNTSLATPSGEPKKRSPRYQVRALVGSYKAETGDDVGAGEVPAPKTNWPVFIVSGVLIIAMVLYAGFGRESAAETLANVTGWIGTNLGWFYVLTATIAVVFVLYIAFSNAGGKEHGYPGESIEFRPRVVRA